MFSGRVRRADAIAAHRQSLRAEGHHENAGDDVRKVRQGRDAAQPKSSQGDPQRRPKIKTSIRIGCMPLPFLSQGRIEIQSACSRRRLMAPKETCPRQGLEE